jgi:hypothetical protein
VTDKPEIFDLKPFVSCRRFAQRPLTGETKLNAASRISATALHPIRWIFQERS